jgi:hypothetical protein
LFTLIRPALAALDHVYDFISQHDEDFGIFSDGLVEELRTIKAMLLLAGCDLGSPWSPVAFCSDACPSGFALSEAVFPVATIRQVARCRERWRFRGLADEAFLASPGPEFGVARLADWSRDEGLLAEYSAERSSSLPHARRGRPQRLGARALVDLEPRRLLLVKTASPRLILPI